MVAVSRAVGRRPKGKGGSKWLKEGSGFRGSHLGPATTGEEKDRGGNASARCALTRTGSFLVRTDWHRATDFCGQLFIVSIVRRAHDGMVIV